MSILDEAADVTPSNSTIFRPSALYVGVGGDVTVDLFKGGTNITFPAVFAGTWMPILVSRVYSTDTSATNIVRLF